MESEKANEDVDVLELGTEMDIKDPLIEWYIHRLHRLVQRECCSSMIQMTRLVHHMFIKRRRDLVRLTIVHLPTSSRLQNGTQRTASPTRDGSPRLDSLRPRQLYDTQRDTQTRGS